MTEHVSVLRARYQWREVLMTILEEHGPATSYQLRARARLYGLDLSAGQVAQLLRRMCRSAQVERIGTVSGYWYNLVPIYAIPVSLETILYNRTWQDEMMQFSAHALAEMAAKRVREYHAPTKTKAIKIDQDDIEWTARIAARNALKQQMRSRV